MRLIHKLGFDIMAGQFENQAIISDGAFKVLTVHEQHGNPYVWYETLDKPVIPKMVAFKVVGTGQPIPEHAIYCGTAFHGHSVWHVYQVPV